MGAVGVFWRGFWFSKRGTSLMDPSMQQAMIQALMGQGMAAPGTTGQNATTPYGQGFMTGNMMYPSGAANMFGGQNQAANAGQQQPGMNSSSNLTNGFQTQLQQPMSTY